MKTVEISPKEYWKRMNYYDAILYCQLLNIDGREDWRMPSKKETPRGYTFKWTVEDADCHEEIKKGGAWWIIPVRDISVYYL